MKITALDIFHVKPSWMFLKLSTDEGLAGWGEPSTGGRARTTAAAVEELRPLLIGQDPRRIEHLWQTLFRSAHHHGGPIAMSAISGIEHALWDIKARALNVPVYELLGGACRTRIRMMARCGGASPQDAAFQAKALRVKGYSAVVASLEGLTRQIDSPDALDKAVARIAAVRTEVGRTIDVAVDARGRLTPAAARRALALLEPLGPLFVAEPTRPDNLPSLTHLAAATVIPLAVGARLHSRWDFRDALERRAASVVQPALCHAGGIFETRKIAAMAEADHVAVAPANPAGPIALAACLQIAACTPNFIAQEHLNMSNKWDVGHGYLTAPFLIHEGYLEIPKGPGLGFEVNEETLRERAWTGEPDTPRQAHSDDGSFLE